MVELGQYSEALVILAAIRPSQPERPQGSIIGMNLVITWKAPRKQGGGDIKVTSYTVQI